MRILFALFAGAFLFQACGDSASTANEAPSAVEQEEKVTEPASSIQLTDFSESPAFSDATITKMMYQNGRFDFDIEATDYELGAQTPDAEQKMCANSGKGQHFHIIVDNAPYSAKYESEFDYDIADGEHYLLAFLSRSYHESIKTDAASVAKKITVANKSITAESDITEPMLFYSRPKGKYVGKKETDKVMLDFFVQNLTLGADYKVLVEVNGDKVATIDEWKPYFFEGMPMGEHTVKLTLLDANGAIVDTPLNPVERTIELIADPVEEL